MKFSAAANALLTIASTTVVVHETMNRRFDNERAELAAVIERLQPILEQQDLTMPADGKTTSSGGATGASTVLDGPRSEYRGVDARREERARHLLWGGLKGSYNYLTGYVTQEEFDEFVSNTADEHIALKSRIASLESTVSDGGTAGKAELVGTGVCIDALGEGYERCWFNGPYISLSRCREAAISTSGAIGFEYHEDGTGCKILGEDGMLTDCPTSLWTLHTNNKGTGGISHTIQKQSKDDYSDWSCYRI